MDMTSSTLNIGIVRRFRRPFSVILKGDSSSGPDWTLTDTVMHHDITIALGYFNSIAQGGPIDYEGVRFHSRAEPNQRDGFTMDVSTAVRASSITPRQNCSLSWTLNEVSGPFGSRSVRTEVHDGVPVSVLAGDDRPSSVEITATFDQLTSLRSGRIDALQALTGGNVKGDLVDLMCIAGLVSSNHWSAEIRIPPDVADSMILFASLIRSADHHSLGAVMSDLIGNGASR
jgi:hypothetical protein